ncbi:hypothetical protein EBL_c38300 [Shimwellia blattae DSM 4481 = NBRC 105725]|uniref:Uncharacterized protein n=1 Tax=Shimwellia blattae (strain ATCC 29907 / DSM 4481 / JCM 1650 / NBRC 105725 / CDC 9005-74) TaxID=630626 RepID=I2BEA4_SHIBC|nr:hypothetical protein EBL_c38300 [Shimwellia blattae DSM 4481 = NBRC 105725]
MFWTGIKKCDRVIYLSATDKVELFLLNSMILYVDIMMGCKSFQFDELRR